MRETRSLVAEYLDLLLYDVTQLKRRVEEAFNAVRMLAV